MTNAKQHNTLKSDNKKISRHIYILNRIATNDKTHSMLQIETRTQDCVYSYGTVVTI